MSVAPHPIADARDDPLQVASCRSAHLSKQPSKALSSRQWMQAIPKKPYTMFLQYPFGFV